MFHSDEATSRLEVARAITPSHLPHTPGILQVLFLWRGFHQGRQHIVKAYYAYALQQWVHSKQLLQKLEENRKSKKRREREKHRVGEKSHIHRSQS